MSESDWTIDTWVYKKYYFFVTVINIFNYSITYIKYYIVKIKNQQYKYNLNITIQIYNIINFPSTV